MNERICVLSCLWLLTSACATTETHHVITGRPAAAHKHDVAVYMSGSPAPAHEEVAILQAVGKGGHADLKHVVAGLREEAATLGCNAIVNVKVDQGANQASGTALCVLIPPRNGPPPPVAPAPLAAAPAVPPQPPPAETTSPTEMTPPAEPETPPEDPAAPSSSSP